MNFENLLITCDIEAFRSIVGGKIILHELDHLSPEQKLEESNPLLFVDSALAVGMVLDEVVVDFNCVGVLGLSRADEFLDLAALHT